MRKDIKIYGLENEVVIAIDRMAKEHGMSRNKYPVSYTHLDVYKRQIPGA